MTVTRTASTRDRLVDATVHLLKKQGPASTGTAEILSTASAPRGSFYFHFPDGKDQLVREAVNEAGKEIGAKITEVFSQTAPLEDRIARYFDLISDDLESANFELGCAVGATTLDIAATNATTRIVAGGAFANWLAEVENAALAEGLETSHAHDLASTFVAAIEGATMLARATHSRQPLDAAARVFRVAVRALIAS